MTELDVYIVGVPAVIALIVIESLISARRATPLYELGDTLGSIGLLAGNALVALAVKALTLASFFAAYELRLWTLSDLMPPWAVWVCAFLMIDLAFYVFHRCQHRINFLWAIHMNHHCSEKMNFVVAFRQPWLAPIAKIPFFSILPLAGLDPTVVVVAGVASTLWGVVGHTQIIGRLGPLEWLLNTPSHHRVHHGANPAYIDKNYGNLVMIWDRLFGTFAAEKEPVVFGLTHNLATNNPYKITTHAWVQIGHDLARAGSLREVLHIIFGPPDEQPQPPATSERTAPPPLGAR